MARASQIDKGACTKAASDITPGLEEKKEYFILDTNSSPINKQNEILASEIEASFHKISIPDLSNAATTASKYNPAFDAGTVPLMDAELTPNAKSLLHRLKILNFYPQKIDLDKIMEINLVHLNDQLPNSEAELVRHYFKRILLLDTELRSLHMAVDEMDSSGQSSPVDPLFEEFELIENQQTEKDIKITPMELQMAVIHCSNDAARQWIYEKLATCQFSLPLVMSTPSGVNDLMFCAWPLRSIRKTWVEKIDITEASTSIPALIKKKLTFHLKLPVVTFLRIEDGDELLGDASHTFSKSSLINSIISKHKHPVFFTRDCPGSEKFRLLSDGLVEIAWYLPGIKTDDHFTQAVTFVNLRGNALTHSKQSAFLLSISSVLVIQLPDKPSAKSTNYMNTVSQQTTIPILLLYPGESKNSASKNDSRTYQVACKNKNKSLLHKEVIKVITKCLSNPELQLHSLDDIKDAAMSKGIRIDENNKSCQQAKSTAAQLLDEFNGTGNSENRKQEVLPLQGEKYWHKWAKLCKSYHRLQINEAESLETQRCRIKSQMDEVRDQQRGKDLSEFFNHLLKIFFRYDWAQMPIVYVLFWLNDALEHQYANQIIQLQEEYNRIWKKIQSYNDPNSAELAQCQTEIKSIIDKINNCSIGTNYFLRETAQHYECTIAKRGMCFIPNKQLPKIGAQMLIHGYPLELMDGNASQVPIEWVKAVIAEVSHKLDDKKLFVLSVLGLQSSGKSTLLNTMFGLQFSVSAGRCTQGVYMQLLHVQPEISAELGYEYLLVVDSEGLRSAELSGSQLISRDNELATFTIGVSQLTIVNIMGENASEMQDVLQVCVQAILRMKKAKLRPSVLFVHQNVAAFDAQSSNMEGRRCLMKNLDQMTQLAAREVGFENINYFADVIQFNMDTQVFYFKNLFMGDPPMAPPNTSYAHNVDDLKKKVLTIKQWLPNFAPPTIKEFSMRVANIWESLLDENFVFSFKNMLEMSVYNNLENAFSQWSWRLRKYVVEAERAVLNRIKSKQIYNVNYIEIYNNYSKEFETIKNEVEKYFQSGSHPEVLIQWKSGVLLRFENLLKEQVDDTMRKSKEALALLQHRSDIEKDSDKYIEQFNAESRKLSQQLRGTNMTDAQMEEYFNLIWQRIESSIQIRPTGVSEYSLQVEIESILVKYFSKIKNISTIVEQSKGEFTFEKKKHYTGKTKAHFSDSHVDDFEKRLENTVQVTIKNWKDSEQEFSPNLIHLIIKNITEEYINFNDNVAFHKSKLNEIFLTEFAVAQCKKNIPEFLSISNEFNQKNNPLTYLRTKREAFFGSFKNSCIGANSVVLFVDFIFKIINNNLENEVIKRATTKIVHKLKCNHPVFNGNRSNIENYLLKYLAEEEDFSLYNNYFTNPQLALNDFVYKILIKQLFVESNFQNELDLSVEEITCDLNLACAAACDIPNRGETFPSNWLDKFCSELGGKLIIDRNDFKSIEQENISDIKHLENYFNQSIGIMINIDEKKIALETIELMRKMDCCWNSCPFCGAICTNTIKDHDSEHSVERHRSTALLGWQIEDSNEFSIEFCGTLMSSDKGFYRHSNEDQSFKFKQYKKAGEPYSDWKLTPDNSETGYWKWVICRFKKDLEAKYKLKFKGHGEIPESWYKITKESILQELMPSNV